jgi:hypothetical protein
MSAKKDPDDQSNLEIAKVVMACEGSNFEIATTSFNLNGTRAEKCHISA